MSEPRLLDDEQVREFVANGFLLLTPDVAPGLHEEIDALLRFAQEKEGGHGNNILSRIPRMHEVLNCPVVRGALISLAGPDYFLHPHRAVHSSTPVEDACMALSPEMDAPRMGKGSLAGSGWHQDAQSPLARARHHWPRYLIGFYFPHATPVAMGATRIQAGSHLHAQPAAPRAVVLDDVPAGAFLLLHFDMVHAGFPNRTDKTRYMVKFVFARTRHPDSPSWRSRDARWRRPVRCLASADVPAAWGAVWHWLRGAAPPNAKNGASIDDRLARFNDADQAKRLESIYAGAGEGDVERLAEALAKSAGRGRHERVLAKDERGRPLPRDDTRGFPRRWNERAIVMEDAAYALAAAGPAAQPALERLLAHADPWVRINAAFALGELGPCARDAAPKLADLLESPLSQVVRQALDALGAIGEGLAPALPKIERLLAESNPAWQAPQVMRGWTAEDQVRMNALQALLNAIHAGEHLDEIERLAGAALGDKNGYVSAIAIEILVRIGTPSAQARALRFLAERRWDDTLRGRAKPF